MYISVRGSSVSHGINELTSEHNGRQNAEYLLAYDANVASLLCMTITLPNSNPPMGVLYRSFHISSCLRYYLGYHSSSRPSGFLGALTFTACASRTNLFLLLIVTVVLMLLAPLPTTIANFNFFSFIEALYFSIVSLLESLHGTSVRLINERKKKTVLLFENTSLYNVLRRSRERNF